MNIIEAREREISCHALASLQSSHLAFCCLQYGKLRRKLKIEITVLNYVCDVTILSPDVKGEERPLKRPKMAAAEMERILNAKSSHDWVVKEVRSLYLRGQEDGLSIITNCSIG